jgi:thiamine-phosphate pyrophosphorylase
MPSILLPPITYLITSGETLAATTPSSKEFTRVLKLIEAAVAARISLIQLREKKLNARTLYALTLQAVAITRGTATRLLVNQHASIAAAAGADGVHLTTRSLEADVIRENFGADFLIGVSTHSLAEAREVRAQGADFVVFGPVFETVSKQLYGAPLGLARLAEVAFALAPFPVLALGGVSADNARACIEAGAAGIAGISLFQHTGNLQQIVGLVQEGAR